MPDHLLVGSYDHRLVVLSILISCVAAYAALDLAGRVTSAEGAARRLWLVGGATAMGLGIWSMHYIGMLAFHLPVPVLYDWPTVLLSLVAAIGASGTALVVVSRPRLGLRRAVAGSVMMGGGIAAMHYIGMAAMRLAAICRFAAPVVALSVALAIVISFVALWITFHFLGEVTAWGWKKIASAALMGAAIPVMHYTGMAAASFVPAPLADQDLWHAVSVSSLGIAGIVAGTLMVLGLVVLTAMADRQFSIQVRERQEAESARVEIERAYEVTIGAAPIGIARIAPDGRWQRVNPWLVQLLGYTHDELSQTTVFGLMHPDDEERAEAARRELVTGAGDRAAFEARCRRRDGQYIWAGVTMRANRDGSGQPRDLITIVEDITERRALDEQSRQSQKMEAIGRLAAGVAHDFNNLLTVIIGFNELTIDRLDPDHPSRPDLEQAILASRSAATLTSQLLAFSRKQMLRPEVLDLNVIVGRMEMLIRRTIGEHVRPVFRLARTVDAVSADPGQVEQVVMNLAVNARDAMPAGGDLTIETDNVRVDAAAAREHEGVSPGPHVRISIGDTGVGIPESVRVRLFEPFFTTKARSKGTGLGLATVYGIVKQSGGFITVESELGRGTTFHCYFPRAERGAVTRRAHEMAAAMGGTETLLVAEDQSEVRAIMRAALARHGYTVLEAGGPDEAMRVAADHGGTIDLLLTDVVMPGMTGGDLARLFLARRPGSRVLFTSGYSDHTVVRDGVIEQGLAFIQKPFSPDALLRKVREVLDMPAIGGARFTGRTSA
jgi:PAS domain S-box-containing protein